MEQKIEGTENKMDYMASHMDGFVPLDSGRGCNQGYFIRLVNKETFETVTIIDEELDQEEFWNILGLDEGEIVEELEAQGVTDVDKEIAEEGPAYQKIIRDKIEAEEIILGKQKRTPVEMKEGDRYFE